MLEERNLKLDLFALGVLAVAIFLGLAMVTYDPADPPSTLVFPTNAEVANVCGRFGAWAADFLFQGLGIGAYYLAGTFAVVGAMLLSGRSIDQVSLRVIGWCLSLVGLTTLAAMAVPQLSPGPVIGAGGYLGAAGRGLLEVNFAAAGAYILMFCVLAAGLLLSTDYVLLKLTSWLIAKPAVGVGGRMVKIGRNRLARRQTAANEEDEYDEEDEYEDDEYEYEDEEEEEEDVPAQPVAVRIRGKHVDDSEEKSDSENATAARAVAPVAKKPGRKPKKTRAGLAIKIPAKERDEREEVMQELDAASLGDDAFDYQLPSIDMLLEGEPFEYAEQEKDIRRKAKQLEKTFANFGLNVKVVEVETGPVIAQFEVELEAGLRLSKITSLADDLAIGLRVPSVRIVAPIPGKNTVGIEVPNTERQIVRLREVIEEANGRAQRMNIPIYLGKDVSGKSMVVDLSTLPHLLIAGRTGTGKSVCLNSIITSMLMTRRPDEVRMLLIDPKMVELSPYKTIPHLMHPVVTDMHKAEAILAWAVEKMEERYSLLARAGVRNITGYNQLGEEELMDRLAPESDEERKEIPSHLPFIVIVADEMADLMMTSAKEVETHIIRLAQKSRAVGIHLVLATQKPTVDVITGLIKSNLPARIAFQVASRTDSRVVLDEMGADKLLGNGDMLFLWPGTSTLLRGQGTYVGDEEINGVVDFISTAEPQFVTELVQLKVNVGEGSDSSALKGRDELYEAAIDVVVREGRGSVSLLQRALGVGYGRAARLIDFMAEDGIVGPYNGSQAREILISIEQWEQKSSSSNEESSGGGGLVIPPASIAPPAKKKPNRQPIEEEAEEEEELGDESDEYEEDDVEDEYEEEDETYEVGDSSEEESQEEAEDEDYEYEEDEYESSEDDEYEDEEEEGEEYEEDSDEEDDEYEEYEDEEEEEYEAEKA